MHVSNLLVNKLLGIRNNSCQQSARRISRLCSYGGDVGSTTPRLVAETANRRLQRNRDEIVNLSAKEDALMEELSLPAGGDTSGAADGATSMDLQPMERPNSKRLAKPNSAVVYRPSSALSLARKRWLKQYLPSEHGWQGQVRTMAERMPESNFQFVISGLILVGTSLAAGVAAWVAWPICHDVVLNFFHANAIEARVRQELTYETQFLAAISLVTAILLGNTFAFSFDRQRQIIQAMSEEVFAVELLVQEAFLELPEPKLRWSVIRHVRKYVENEIQSSSTSSPFNIDGAIVAIFQELENLKKQGKGITRMLSAVEMLAQANSRRVATSAALLPALHWVLLSSLCVMVLSSFILFDSDMDTPVEENRMIFAVLAAIFYSILQVLGDMANADEGLYSIKDTMDHRLSFVRWQMDNILTDPAIKVSILSKDGGSDSESDSEDTKGEEANINGTGKQPDKSKSEPSTTSR